MLLLYCAALHHPYFVLCVCVCVFADTDNISSIVTSIYSFKRIKTSAVDLRVALQSANWAESRLPDYFASANIDKNKYY